MKLPRFSVEVTVMTADSSNREADAFDGVLLNLSHEGALLLGAPHLEPGTRLGMSIEGVRVEGLVRRTELLGGGVSALGISVLPTSSEAKEQLVQLVADSYRALGATVLGQLRSQMQRDGITDVQVVADAYQQVKEEQARAMMYSADLYTAQGSDTNASIISATTGEERNCIVWSLNLYLGLNRVQAVVDRTCDAVRAFGTGSGTSAPSGGLNAMHDEIATRVAHMVGKPSAILFPTGYSANLGALSTLPGPRDLLLLDREAHASMFDGVKLSGKKYLAFRHNDVADLRSKLERYAPRHENVFVVVESAYSMSGDLSPLEEIVALKQQFDFLLYVDEAHTFGFYGKQGRGYCHQLGVSDQVDFIMSTLSKATASSGGFVAAEERFCTLMQSTSSAYIFQACLTPPDAATVLASLDEIRDNPDHSRRLHESNAYMRASLIREGFDLGSSQSPVIPVYVPDVDKLFQLCAHLHMEGIYSVPVTYPAVGLHEGRIRFIVNARHTREQIDQTVAILAGHARALGVIDHGPRTQDAEVEEV